MKYKILIVLAKFYEDISKNLIIGAKEKLKGKANIKLIEVPDEEYESMGCNVLALAPKIALMLKGNPITQSRLEAEDVKVYTYNGDEISLKGSGGPTCLTRPFLRSE